MYIFIENNNTKNGQKKERRKKKKLGRTRSGHLRLDATTPSQYTTAADYVTFLKSL